MELGRSGDATRLCVLGWVSALTPSGSCSGQKQGVLKCPLRRLSQCAPPDGPVVVLGFLLILLTRCAVYLTATAPGEDHQRREVMTKRS